MDFGEIDILALFIKNTGKKYFIKKLTNHRTLYKIPIYESEVVVIYDKRHHCLLTALPENAREIYEENFDNSANALVHGEQR